MSWALFFVGSAVVFALLVAAEERRKRRVADVETILAWMRHQPITIIKENEL